MTQITLHIETESPTALMTILAGIVHSSPFSASVAKEAAPQPGGAAEPAKRGRRTNAQIEADKAAAAAAAAAATNGAAPAAQPPAHAPAALATKVDTADLFPKEQANPFASEEIVAFPTLLDSLRRVHSEISAKKSTELAAKYGILAFNETGVPIEKRNALYADAQAMLAEHAASAQ